MIQALVALSGEKEIAAGDTDIPDVYYDKISGRLKLKPNLSKSRRARWKN